MKGIEALAREVDAAAAFGMQPAVWAARQPDRIAIYDYTGQDRTFGELNSQANRIARLLREAGLSKGDSVALVCTNRAEFCDVLLAALRAGLRCTPVNWHLTGDEIAYIVGDCEAKALFADVRVSEAVQAAALQCPDLRLKAVALHADSDEVNSRWDQPPGKIVDFQVEPAILGGGFDPGPRQPPGGARLKQHAHHHPEEQDDGDSRQNGDDRSPEMAVPQPPRSPHFSFRWSTWK